MSVLFSVLFHFLFCHTSPQFCFPHTQMHTHTHTCTHKENTTDPVFDSFLGDIISMLDHPPERQNSAGFCCLSDTEVTLVTFVTKSKLDWIQYIGYSNPQIDKSGQDFVNFLTIPSSDQESELQWEAVSFHGPKTCAIRLIGDCKLSSGVCE